MITKKFKVVNKRMIKRLMMNIMNNLQIQLKINNLMKNKMIIYKKHFKIQKKLTIIMNLVQFSYKLLARIIEKNNNFVEEENLDKDAIKSVEK